MGDLAVNLPASGDGGIVVRAQARLQVDVAGVVGGLGIDALEQFVDRVGHEYGDHSNFTQFPASDFRANRHAMRGKMPRTTDQQLHTFCIREIAQFLGLGRRESHWLLHQHMFAPFQCRLGLGVMHVRRGGDHHCVQSGQVEQLHGIGHRVLRVKILCDFVGLGLRAGLDGEQFSPRVRQDRRNVCVGGPVTGADHADLQLFHPSVG